MGDYRLSEAELYIMLQFWQHGAMKSDQLAALVADKEWKPTTLLTFLSRLAAKGMLKTEKQGKSNLYTPLITQGEYRELESRQFLDEMYDGSARDFFVAMVNSNNLSPQDITELKKWLSEQEVE